MTFPWLLLVALCGSDSYWVRQTASHALRQPLAVPALSAGLAAADPEVRRHCAIGLCAVTDQLVRWSTPKKKPQPAAAAAYGDYGYDGYRE